MQYYTAKTELQSPPSRIAFWSMLSEGIVLVVAALLLVHMIGD